MIKSYAETARIRKKQIIFFDKLKPFMQPKYIQELKNNENFLIWLGFEKKEDKKKSNDQNNQNQAVKFQDNIEKNNQYSNEIDSTNLIEESKIEEEDSDYDEENAERMLDDDFFIDKNDRIFKNEQNENSIDNLKKKFTAEKGDGFTKVGKGGRDVDPMKELSEKISTNTNEKDILYSKSIFNLSQDDRISLYTFWANSFLKDQNNKLKDLKPKYNEAIKQLNELRLHQDKYIMQNSFIGNGFSSGLKSKI